METWTTWRQQLSSLTNHPIPRYVSDHPSPVIDRQLHGFCDASTVAYGGVVYLRLLHEDTSASVRLMMSKTRVAPIEGLTIPRMELCGGVLLAKLLASTASDLEIPKKHLYAWCDSTIVLGWLNKPLSSLVVFVANRVREISTRVDTQQWRYVNTAENPADYASRGIFPEELIRKEMWWCGPQWLRLSNAEWPRREDINLLRELPDLKRTVLTIQKKREFGLWSKAHNLDHLIRLYSRLVEEIQGSESQKDSQKTEDLRTRRIGRSKTSSHQV